ncbi:transposase family protein [Bacteroidales bacterium OttesenSCG-928-J16]|nr:transposase family protein [Bacteroidales bacterium OttesenSCG-928-J16]
MKQWQILRTIFPDEITSNFEFVDYKESDLKLEYWLDGREYMSRDDYRKGTIRPYGFTESKTIQDFPIRGRSVYLHIRRRKWIDRSTGEMFVYSYENLTETGSKLSPDFVAFLKEEN